MKKLTHETKLLLGAFTGTFAVVLALGLRQPAGIDPVVVTGFPSVTRAAGASPVPALPQEEPLPVVSAQTGLMPRPPQAATLPLPTAAPVTPLVEPPPGDEDYAPQNNY